MNRYRSPTPPLAAARRPWRIAAATISALCLAAGFADPPLIGVHYQDLTPAGGRDIAVFIPRPALAHWTETAVSTGTECLMPGALADPGPGYALILHATVADVATCRALVEVTFREGARTHTGVVIVQLRRVELPSAAAGTLTPTLGISQVSLPTEGPILLREAPLVSLLLTNTSGEELRVSGPADPAALQELVGELYGHTPAAFDGSWPSLAAGGPVTGAALGPGEQVGYALVLDPQRRLPSGSSVVSVQIAVVFEQAGQLRALLLDRLVTARGSDLP